MKQTTERMLWRNFFYSYLYVLDFRHWLCRCDGCPHWMKCSVTRFNKCTTKRDKVALPPPPAGIGFKCTLLSTRWKAGEDEKTSKLNLMYVIGNRVLCYSLRYWSSSSCYKSNNSFHGNSTFIEKYYVSRIILHVIGVKAILTFKIPSNRRGFVLLC